jgi:tRNA U34 5-methylaminomethyl-2-thiouridine-forming methyltransferase MnmC
MKPLSIITTEDGSHSLFNSELNETYHSIHGAVRESMHVFIQAGLAHSLQNKKKSNLRIFETGFGTGLNAFLTCLHPALGVNVYYESWEAYPIEPEVSRQLNYPDSLGSPELYSTIHTSAWDQAVAVTKSFTLHKHKGNIMTDQLTGHSLFDLIYYDAFGPSKQPQMWTKEVLGRVVALLDDRGTFVTYCAKGQVKRDLKSLGLKVETLPGPPGKLQMIRATKE